MSYRVNYGNGQVGPVVPERTTAERLANMERETNRGAYAPFVFVQRYEVGSADAPGEWVRVEK